MSLASSVAGMGLTGTASLAEELDKRLMVVLRDGRKIIGVLRSFDQFANVVLEEALERIVVGTKFADAPLGLYVIRGENVVLLGTLDDAKEEQLTSEMLTRVPLDEVMQAKRDAEEALRLKASLSRAASKAAADPWDFD